MVALLVWLLALLLGVVTSTSSSSSQGAPTVQATPVTAPAPFTLDGVPGGLRQPVVLHRGQLLRLAPRFTSLRIARLECRGDVHRLTLAHRAWRVPDLPSGEYRLTGRGARWSFTMLASVRSHDAPCPTA